MEELILLMHGVVSTIITAKKAGLDDDSFVLDPRHIYMKQKSTQPQLVYLPMRSDSPLQAGFSLLVNYLLSAADPSNALTGQILEALKNVAAGAFSLQDVAAIVVNAANNKAVDEKYLKPQQPAKQGFLKRMMPAAPAEYANPLDSIDERTILSLTGAAGAGMTMAVLYVLEDDTRTMQIPITKDPFVLGRKRDEVDCCFDDKGISRVHASIIFDGKEYFVSDKGSSGGTFVNGKRIPPVGSQRIQNGDVIGLYNKKLLFECE
jgi:hypothetical protein